ncbi:nitroreductase [Candidatus Poribacteria bacterium]|nr:nitroreductase [Candidatus Poribacteria bacterium]
MNETLETMWNRRSVRKYKSDPLPPEHLRLILETARRAPTGGNRQKWRMIVISDPDLRRKTAEACSHQMWMADAAVILCLVTEPGEGQVNGAIVLDQAILAATSLGYGTCWVGAYDADKIREVLDIPDDYGIICLTPVGVSADEPKARPRKSPGELFMREQFGTPIEYDV